MPGHWEGDLIKGAGNKSAVRMLVERSTRLVLLCKMSDATAQSALEAFTAKFNQIAAPMRQTLTYDQGREMTCHPELAQATNMRVFFCDPHSPWQRGSCENTNGLLRQFLPKGSDLSVHDQDALGSITDLMNNRPPADAGQALSVPGVSGIHEGHRGTAGRYYSLTFKQLCCTSDLNPPLIWDIRCVDFDLGEGKIKAY